MKNKKIPSGKYCYEIEDIKYKKFPMIKTKNCPYYVFLSGEEGHCEKLNIEINDCCKECGINE